MLSLFDLIVVRVEVQYLLSQASRQGRRGIGKDLKSRTFLRPLPHHDSACSVTLECCSNSRGLKSTQGLTKCCLVVGNANVKAWHSTFSCKLFTAQHTSNAISSWDGATHPCEMGRETERGWGLDRKKELRPKKITSLAQDLKSTHLWNLGPTQAARLFQKAAYKGIRPWQLSHIHPNSLQARSSATQAPAGTHSPCPMM